MKTFIQLVVACLISHAISAQGDIWTKKANFGGGLRQGAVGFSIGSKGYIGTGSNGFGYTKDFWEYDPDVNTWTQKADFGGTARWRAVGFSIDNFGYIGTGVDYGNDAIFKDFWQYDPVANTWTQKADFAGTARNAAAGFSIGSKGYMGTGEDITAEYTYKDFWQYDPAADTWTQKADVGGPARTRAAGLSIGSKGYMGGGYLAAPPWGDLKDFWEYDPAADTWTQKADFGGIAREFAVGFSIGHIGYMGTGYTESNDRPSGDFWEYEPGANTWKERAFLWGGSRQRAVGFSIGGRGYLGTGGFDFGYSDFYEYTPDYIPGDNAPVITEVTDINSSQAYIHWKPVSNAVSYLVRRYRAGTSDYGDYLPVTDTFRKINNMSANSVYVARIKAYLNNGDSTDWSAPYSFTTANTCAVPLKPRVSLITDTSARLSWSLPVITATNFRIRYKESVATEWSVKSKKGTETKYILKGLKPSTLYNWQIRSSCTDDVTEWVIGTDFTTTSTSLATLSTTAPVKENVTVKNGLLVSPNPSKGQFTIQAQLPGKAAPTTFTLYNNLGEKVWQYNAGSISGKWHSVVALDNKLTAGIYTLTLQRSDIKLVQKILISK